MTQDQNKKTLRHFQCRDYLWDIFEQMSAELECSTDYLINEAMRQYARSRNYGGREASSEAARSAPAPVSRPGIPSLRSGAGSQPVPGSMPPPPPGPPTGRPSAAPTPPPASPQMRASVPPPLPRGQRQAPPPSAQSAPPAQLYIIFNGQKIPVNKPEFVIGRGAKSADLPIKDGNISRRHAAVVYQNGQYFMKDLGSTNGVEFAGQRIDAKQIQEGDVFRMCDYELQFTYR